MNIAIIILTGFMVWALACLGAFCWQTWVLTGRIW